MNHAARTSRDRDEAVPAGGLAPTRVIGVDAGTDSVKVVELVREAEGWRLGRRQRCVHGNDPAGVLRELLATWDWETIHRAAVTGAGQGLVNLPAVPVKHAQSRGARHFLGERPATVVSIGSRGFSVLELHGDGLEVYRQNSRCSQGTGNFLRQLLERLSLSVEEADALAAEVQQPAVLSARCPSSSRPTSRTSPIVERSDRASWQVASTPWGRTSRHS